jgi:predicted DCC family thiol-disulfide oxidoreductase YuxK
MKNLIIFDGTCNFCDAYINFVIDHDRTNKFQFASSQTDFAKNILSKLNVDASKSIVLLSGDKYFFKSDAVLEISRQLSSSISWVYVFRFIFPSFLRNFVYDIVAKNRYLLMGKLNECKLPTPELRAKFLS